MILSLTSKQLLAWITYGEQWGGCVQLGVVVSEAGWGCPLGCCPVRTRLRRGSGS